MEMHLVYHTGERRFTCEVCGQSFFAINALKRHTKLHTGKETQTYFTVKASVQLCLDLHGLCLYILALTCYLPGMVIIGQITQITQLPMEIETLPLV